MKDLYILVFLSFLLASGCEERKRNSNKSAFEKEKELINDYHRKVVIEKGNKTLFIPKNEISWYFKSKKKVPLDSVQKGDNISFFDEVGNIQYQAVVSRVKNDLIHVNCLDLSSGDFYETKLSVESIKDLNPSVYYEICCYR